MRPSINIEVNCGLSEKLYSVFPLFKLRTELVEQFDSSRIRQRVSAAISILRSKVDRDHYCKVTLSSDACAGHNESSCISHLGLVACVGEQPDGYVAGHIRERLDNSIGNLQWLPRADNSLKEKPASGAIVSTPLWYSNNDD